MRQLVLRLAAGALHAAFGAAIALALEGALGTVAAVAVAALAVLATRPLHRRLEAALLRRAGGAEHRRRAAVHRLLEGLDAPRSLDDAPDAVAAELARLLRCPQVALVLRPGDLVVGLHDEGPADRHEKLPVLHEGEEVGLVRLGLPPGARPDAVLALAAEVVPHTGPLLRALGARRELEATGRRAAAARRERQVAVSHDVHDRLGPSLAALKMVVAVRRRSGAGTPEVAGPALAAQVDEVLAELRRIVRREGPVAVAEHGLVAGVELAAARLTLTGPELLLEAGALPPLSPEVEAAAHAVVVEAVANVVRHAGAGSCRVELRCEDGALVVAVEDDGAGLATGPRAEGLGLVSMRERGEALGGRFEAGPRPAGGGTRVEARLPVAARPALSAPT